MRFIWKKSPAEKAEILSVRKDILSKGGMSHER